MSKKLSDLIGQFATIPNSFIVASRDLTTETKWLFVVLRYHTNAKTGTAFPSYTTISELTGFHRQTIAKSLKELEKAGWLTKQRRYSDSNLYTLQIPSSSISDTTETASSSINSTISSSDSVNTNQTEITKLTPHGELMAFLRERYGPIAHGAREGKAVKWLLTNGYTAEQCVKCFECLAKQTWRGTQISWVTVESQIGAFVRGELSTNGNGYHPNSASSGKIIV